MTVTKNSDTINLKIYVNNPRKVLTAICNLRCQVNLQARINLDSS